MATMRVNFASCVQDSRDYGSDDQYVVSRVFFSIWCGGQRYTGLYSDIKHPVDADIETNLLEITLPHGYDGPISSAAFRRSVGQYYRSLIGRGVLGARIGESCTRMCDNTFLVPRSFEFPLAEI